MASTTYNIQHANDDYETWFGGGTTVTLDPSPGTGTSYTLTGTASNGDTTTINNLDSNYNGTYQGYSVSFKVTSTNLDSDDGNDQTSPTGCIEANGG